MFHIAVFQLKAKKLLIFQGSEFQLTQQQNMFHIAVFQLKAKKLLIFQGSEFQIEI